MKNFAITSGNFTAQGNFSGYTALGQRLHIYKAQMDSAGWKELKDVKFPFYAVGHTTKINILDRNDNNKPVLNADGTPKQEERLTATSIFATKEGLITARVDEQTLNFSITKGVAEEAKKAGLTDAELKMLLQEAV